MNGVLGTRFKIIAVVIVGGIAPISACAALSVPFHDSGFFRSEGSSAHDDFEGFNPPPGAFANYHVGMSTGFTGPDIFVKNFFIFDFTSLGLPPGAMITSATLELFSPSVGTHGVAGYTSGDPSEIYEVSDLGGLTETAVMDHYDHPSSSPYGGVDESGAAMAVYASLATGPTFAIAPISAGDDGGYIGIPLGAPAIGYLNAELGTFLGGGDSLVGFGGFLSSIAGTEGGAGGDEPDEYIFGFTHPNGNGAPDTSATPPMLMIEVSFAASAIPEPGTISLLLLAAPLLRVFVNARRHRNGKAA